MKKAMVALFLTTVLFGVVLYNHLNTSQEAFVVEVGESGQYAESTEINLDGHDFIHDSLKVVEEINIRNSKVKNFASNATITISGVPVNLSAFIAYEKNKNFRLIANSILGKETDIGSNSHFFWFWSKRMVPNALYYAKYEDLNKTRLRTPFNPSWMMESFCLSTLDTDKAVVIDQEGKYLRLIEKRKNAVGNVIFKATLIDPQQKIIYGHYLYNETGRPIASTEIKQYFKLPNGDYLPAKFLITWHEENVKMTLILNRPQLNVRINEEVWDLPRMRNVIDMGKD